ncbi:MAG TPA: flagellar biosynthetic protein FliO [Roseiflexaceae bacterium]|nr:flagellar biosynthetic protein FliO [Roseiflexaceae bacterium]
MRNFLSKLVCVCAGLFAHAIAFAQDKPLFAAPQPTDANGSSAGSIGQVTLALAVVLGVVFAAAWALKQARRLNLAGNPHGLHVVGQVALGAKERAVLVQVNGVQVLVGVAPGQVTALHTFTEIPAAPPASQTPTTEQAVASSFKSILKNSLGLR